MAPERRTRRCVATQGCTNCESSSNGGICLECAFRSYFSTKIERDMILSRYNYDFFTNLFKKVKRSNWEKALATVISEGKARAKNPVKGCYGQIKNMERELERKTQELKELQRQKEELKELERQKEELKELERQKEELKELERQKEELKELERQKEGLKESERQKEELKDLERRKEELKAMDSELACRQADVTPARFCQYNERYIRTPRLDLYTCTDDEHWYEPYDSLWAEG